MGMCYVAEPGGVIRPTDDYQRWGEWYEWGQSRSFAEGGRRVGIDIIGGARVSTVFLGLDHGHHGGEPVLFETMVFGGEHAGYQRRYHTHAEAVAGHRDTVSLVAAARGE